MDFARRTRRIKIEKDPEIVNLETLYPLNVSMYLKPPSQDITIESFEELVIDRLKVLRILEQYTNKGLKLLSSEWKEAVLTELKKQKLKGYLRLIQGGGSKATEADLLARQHDYISHFLLRLVYCRSADLRRWFIQRELELFRFKFSAMSTAEIKQFLEFNKMDYTPITDEQKSEIKDCLYESTMGQSNYHIEMLDFYKVDFQQVIDLVRHRRCFVRDGFAYVSTQDFISVVTSKLLNIIEWGLEDVITLLPEIEADERISALVKGLHTSYIGKDYTLARGESVPIESLDELSKKSFPLCMRLCHEHLREKHHHKYFARMQYGLFLKGINVTLEDSLRFWQEEFCKIITEDTFNKQYRYNIRHNYGKEGARTNYTPYSCIKIIQTQASSTDPHGCPFKTRDASVLKSKLSSYGLSTIHVQEVVALSSKHHYQLACGKLFEIMHNTPFEEGVNHPNQYFNLSQTVQGKRVTSVPQNIPSTSNTPRIPGTLPAKRRTTNQTSMFDENFDEELWNAAEETQAKFDRAKAEEMEWNEELDISEVEHF